jgi:hypothetical protein
MYTRQIHYITVSRVTLHYVTLSDYITLITYSIYHYITYIQTDIDTIHQ